MWKEMLVLSMLLICTDWQLVMASAPIAYDTPLALDTVRIGGHYVEMPPGRILLLRKGGLYGAIKLTRFWSGKTTSQEYASYECWYRDDGSGSLSTGKEKHEVKEASSVLRGAGRLSFNFGNEEIECGVFRLWWWGKGAVYFFGKGQDFGDYGIEMSPTKWTEIKEVDAFDKRLRWYKYEKSRPRIDMAIDSLW